MKLAPALPGVTLALGVLLLSGIREQYSVQPRLPMRSLGRSYDGSEGTDLVVPKEEREVAGMSDYVMRSFGPDSAPRFTVYVGYYDKQVQGKSIHSPKNCLPGAGWEILDAQRITMPGGVSGQTINHVVLANKGYRALVAYWYQGRGRVEASEYKVKWNLLRDAAVFGRTEEALVRIVVPLGNSKTPEESSVALVSADSLINALVPQISRSVAQLMPAAPSGSN